MTIGDVEVIAQQAISVQQVRAAVTQTLKTYLPIALQARGAVVIDEIPRGLPQPRAWYRLSDLLRIQEDQSPCVYVLSADAEFEKRQGRYAGTWDVAAVCIVRSQSYNEVADLVGEYVACMRSALLANPRLDGTGLESSGITLIGESYDRGDSDNARTIGGGAVVAGYTIDRVAEFIALEAP